MISEDTVLCRSQVLSLDVYAAGQIVKALAVSKDGSSGLIHI